MTIPFNGTPEQEAQLRAYIQAKKGEPGCLMPVLQEAQHIYGYLPVEVQRIVAEGLGVTLAEVYGVATFYAQFTLTPKGKYQISVCLGTACYVKGSDKVLEAIEQRLGISAGEITPDGKFSIDTCRCVGACGLAPVVVIGEDVYGKMTKNKVDDMLSNYDD